MVVASMIRARSLICLPRSSAGQPNTATVSTAIAIPVLNQLADWAYGNIDDQNFGSSERIQSIAAKLAENASTMRPIALIHDNPERIGSFPARGPHSAKAASKFQSTT